MDTTIHTRVTSPDSDKFGGRKILVKLSYGGRMLSGKDSWAPVKRDFGTRVRFPSSAAISINEPPFALLLRRLKIFAVSFRMKILKSEALLWIFFKEKTMENQEFETAAAKFADSISDYLHSVADHLCEVSKMSRMSVGDLLIDLALLARATERKKEERDAKASEKAI